MTYHATKSDAGIAQVAKLVGYNGRRITVVAAESVDIRTDNHWSGGSRTYYTFVDLMKRKVLESPSQHPYFDPCVTRPLALRPGLVCVAHIIFRGKDLGIRVYAHPDELSGVLPPKAEITDNEGIVLDFTAGLKNTYAGRTNLRFVRANEENGITEEEWMAAKENLIERGFLTKAGAITANGRNALEGRKRTWRKPC